jgi:diguanylate cyclase (GGDEF)-like protein/PAS domain S-box-containing protein
MLAMLEFFNRLFTSNPLIPHEHCYLWKPQLVWLHGGSDLLIGLAYYSIPIMLVYFVQKRRDTPFHWIFLMFGAFIVACGTSHLMEVWTLWHPNYWLSGGIKLLTAFISLYTAAELVHLMPEALALPSSAHLIPTNQKLAQAIGVSEQEAPGKGAPEQGKCSFPGAVEFIGTRLTIPHFFFKWFSFRLQQSPSEHPPAPLPLFEAAERHRILAEAALKQSESRFRLIFEDAAIGIVLADVAGQFLATNPAFQKMVGYSQSELVGMHFKEITHPESMAVEETLYQEIVQGLRDSYPLEKRYITKDGQLIWSHLTVSLVRDLEGNPQFSIAMVQNITERKQAEAALRHYQEHLEELVGARTAELTEANEQLYWQASHDSLTGLVNRREFERCLEKAISSARTSQQDYTLCYLDLDRFKVVNDTCGHLAGDELLRQLSGLLQNRCRKSDTLARLGGDEFGLLLHQCSIEEAMRVVQTLQEGIQEFRFAWQEQTFSLGVSIGLVAIDSCNLNPEDILSAADRACYTAKHQGGNRVHIYQLDEREQHEQRQEMQWVARLIHAMTPTLSGNPCSTSSNGEGELAALHSPEEPLCETQLAQALLHQAAQQQTPTTRDRFRLYYQPIVRLYQDGSSPPATKECYEVLLRLEDETGQVIPAMSFLSAAKRYHLMPSIDRWVIQTFLALLKDNRLAHLGEKGETARTSSQFPISDEALYMINLSSDSVQDQQLVDFIKTQFSNYSISPQVICFEVEESTAIANLTKVAHLVHELKALGCHFALDDFGSGMSSFAYLKYLPVDYLKINGDLVKDMVKDPLDCAMVEAIHSIGRLTGVQTVAEFVADETILEKVKALGVDYAQGFAIAEPRPLWH